ncbi:chitobiase/beta-hexosaminidase C-terminal domain-containing protein [Clostridium colicanis]|nr:chitobiase/beta-hexosaminidase C-terminal domain-containing protein [Clostridium colicanis]
MAINGSLILAEGIGEGDIILENVTVTGDTYVRGSENNSIHFRNSTLATIIVNKNDGQVRIVAEGDTKFIEVQLETPAIVQIPEGARIETLVLNAAANILGNGAINTARVHIGGTGSNLSIRPQNIVLDSGVSIWINGEIISENMPQETTTSIKNVKNLTPTSVDIEFNKFIEGLSINDFVITATLNGEAIELQNLSYDEVSQTLSFSSVVGASSSGKKFKITVSPREGSTKLKGEGKTSNEITLESTGISGRIIDDVSHLGASGVTIKFRSGVNNKDGEVVAETVTDENGYYSVSLPAGQYIGELSGEGYVTGYLYAVVPTDSILTDKNEIIIRAVSLEQIKIVLTWNDKVISDLDSYLVAPSLDGTSKFSISLANRKYEYNGIKYAELEQNGRAYNRYGIETTTIYRPIDGEYYFYAHEFASTTPLGNSAAKVQIFKGNSTVADNSFNVPEGSSDGTDWIVFKLTVSNQGQNVNVTEIGKVEKNLYYIKPIIKIGENEYSSYISETVFAKIGDKITITSSDEDAKIRYTTDGSKPNLNSTLYTGPITVDKENFKLTAMAAKYDAIICQYSNVNITTQSIEEFTKSRVPEILNRISEDNTSIDITEENQIVTITKENDDAIGYIWENIDMPIHYELKSVTLADGFTLKNQNVIEWMNKKIDRKIMVYSGMIDCYFNSNFDTLKSQVSELVVSINGVDYTVKFAN